jgi:hypothetical protein
MGREVASQSRILRLIYTYACWTVDSSCQLVQYPGRTPAVEVVGWEGCKVVSLGLLSTTTAWPGQLWS